MEECLSVPYSYTDVGSLRRRASYKLRHIRSEQSPSRCVLRCLRDRADSQAADAFTRALCIQILFCARVIPRHKSFHLCLHERRACTVPCRRTPCGMSFGACSYRMGRGKKKTEKTSDCEDGLAPLRKTFMLQIHG